MKDYRNIIIGQVLPNNSPESPNLSKKVRNGQIPVRWMTNGNRLKVHLLDFKLWKSSPVNKKSINRNEPNGREIRAIEARKQKEQTPAFRYSSASWYF